MTRKLYDFGIYSIARCGSTLAHIPMKTEDRLKQIDKEGKQLAQEVLDILTGKKKGSANARYKKLTKLLKEHNKLMIKSITKEIK